MFNFGSQNISAFGSSTPAKPTGIGIGSNFSFGAPSTTTSAFGGTPSAKPAFGSTSAFGTSGFGTGTTQSGGFGSFGGLTATTTTSSLNSGFSFGQTPASSAPSLFGISTSTSTGFGGFGTTNTLSRLGSATTTTASLGTGFGNTSFGGTATSGLGTGFGTSNLGGGLGTGFGASGSAPAFGAPGSAPAFGTAAPTPALGSGFGGFSSTFGKPTTSAAPAFGNFNTSFGLQQPSSFQNQIQPQQQQQQLSSDEAFAQSIHNVCIFNDERDAIIAKWNYLQALWGTGKAFFLNNIPAIDITPENYLCRFKSIAYSRIPGEDNKLGYVAITFNKPPSEMKNQQQAFIQLLNQILGNKPNLLVVVDNVKEIGEKTQFIIYVDERSMTNPNESKRILATDLSNHLNQQTFNMQLTNASVESIIPFIQPDADEIEKYLNFAPRGIDQRMWNQAKLDNPDPKQFIPVPIIGFKELKKRIEQQDIETELHTQYLIKVGKDLVELKQRHTASIAKIMESKRRLALLNHEILSIIVRQECTRKIGIPLTAEEEMLRSKLENLNTLVAAPTHFKGRLSELLSQMRMQNIQSSCVISNNSCSLDDDAQEDMKSFLLTQQKTIEFLIHTINRDIKILDRIKEKLLKGKRSTNALRNQIK